jgi:hypothetical protein
MSAGTKQRAEKRPTQACWLVSVDSLLTCSDDAANHSSCNSWCSGLHTQLPIYYEHHV